MTRAAIVNPLRTAVGRFGGTLRPVPAEDLAAIVIRAVVERSGWTRPGSMMWRWPSPTPTPRPRASAAGPR